MRRKIHNAVLLTITVIAAIMFFLGAGSLDSTDTGEWLSVVLMVLGATWLGLFFYANDDQRGGKRDA